MASVTRAHVFLTRGGEILALQQAGGARWWELPGGELEADEGPRNAAIRETFEETGLRIEAPELLRVWRYRGRSGAAAEAYAFAADAPLGDVRLSDEHSAYAWMTVDDYAERYCGERFDQALPDRAEFLVGMRANCAAMREWLREGRRG